MGSPVRQQSVSAGLQPPSRDRMSDENTCRGFRRKSVVMSFIGICCLTLVVWTVIITAHPTNHGEPVAPVNLTTNNTNTTNSSLQAVCPLDSSLSIENVSLSLAKPNLTSQQRIKKIKLDGPGQPHCKCLCQYNVTLSELQEAIAQLQREKSQKMKTKEKNL